MSVKLINCKACEWVQERERARERERMNMSEREMESIVKKHERDKAE